VTLVPFFYRARVYTAYEYLERRFDLKTRTFTSGLFLVSRAMSCGAIAAAPAVVLSVVLGWSVTLTTLRLDSIKGYHGLVVDDMLADFLRIACFVSVSLMLFYSRTYLIARNLFRGDVFVLTLFALLGMQVMITGANFLTLYLGLELMSLSLYALVASPRGQPPCTTKPGSTRWKVSPS